MLQITPLHDMQCSLLPHLLHHHLASSSSSSSSSLSALIQPPTQRLTEDNVEHGAQQLLANLNKKFTPEGAEVRKPQSWHRPWESEAGEVGKVYFRKHQLYRWPVDLWESGEVGQEGKEV